MYLDMLQQWIMLQLQEDKADFILQQDGTPAHFLGSVRDFLNAELPGPWIGRASEDDSHILLWPPRSPNLISCNFFLMGLH